ncbi:unnamed protein product [Lasius platythorax]|uniref:Putative nuclease HARBI1 n=1 Tax=Lasius platythorax TaxID=488582 RepID=A0AAV2PDV5_9HYME
MKLYRLNKQRASNLLDVVTNYIPEPTRRSALNAQTILFTALRFYAGGSYQVDAGLNIFNGVSQPSTSRCINTITNILNEEEIQREWIHFPENLDEMNYNKNRFWQKFNFPNAIGCIDCTHIKIFPPKTDDLDQPERIFVNRKGYHSLNVQLICDADYKIIHVDSKWPGSTHDSFIWNQCNVQPLMRVLYERNQRFFLIGDSGYALRPWMMTPITNAAPHTPEEYYTNRLTSTRSI